MPYPLSEEAIRDKNKLRSDVVWIDFLEVIYPGEDTIRVCSDNDYVTWAGHEWTPVAFTAPELEETKDAQISEAKISFYDITQEITPILDRHSGGNGAIVNFSTALSSRLDNPVPERTDSMEIVSTSINGQSVISITLGAENLSKQRAAVNRYLKNNCRYPKFKEGACRYVGSATECNKTFAQCRKFKQQRRYGGMPAMGNLGYKI